MSLQPHENYLIPEETARVARAIVPSGNLVMGRYDELGCCSTTAMSRICFPSKVSQPKPPRRRARVTLLQLMAEPTDRQAAEAARTRVDRKHLLGLELTDPALITRP